MLTRLPLCKPIPEKLAGCRKVCCCNTSVIKTSKISLASEQCRQGKRVFKKGANPSSQAAGSKLRGLIKGFGD